MKIMESELISIVVPIYNVEKYLKKCIDSILVQTYKNIEIILVDDGSPDNCGAICEEYGKKDSRIKIIHKENGGLSDARNVGIEVAIGKYITFIDSDDYVDENYIAYLYQILKKYKTRISIISNYIITSNGKIIDLGLNYKEESIDKIEALKRMLNEEGYTVSAWSKLYDIELFKNVKFPKGKLCEDNGTTYKLIEQVENVAFGNKSKYYYLKRDGSIMLSTFNEKKLDMIYLTDEMCDFLEKKYPELEKVTKRRKIYARFNILRQMINTNNDVIENEIISYIMKNKIEIILNREYSKRDKFALICLLFGKKFFFKMWNLYKKIKY